MTSLQTVTAIGTIHAAFGTCLFLLFRAWYWYLIRLAGVYDVPTRRRISTLCYLLAAAPATVFLILADLIPTISLGHRLQIGTVSGLLLSAVLFLLAALPVVIWFMRRQKELHALGYGRHGVVTIEGNSGS